MNEEVFQIGPEQNLVGVWTPPSGSSQPVAVLLLNAGVIYRIGAHRTSVKLARHLAGQGYGCARFDLCGVGDSRAPRGAADFRTQAVHDVRTVMDHLQQQHGIRSFVLVGICSGAAHSQATALEDERVRGVFLIDGFVYPTWKGRLHFVMRMLRAYGPTAFAARFARHGWARVAGRRPVEQGTPADDGPQRTREQYAQDMAALTARQVDVTLLFTGSILELYGYPQQLQDSFAGQPWVSRVKVLFEPDIDHTVTLRASQQRLLQRVTQWLRTVSGQAGADSAAGAG